MSRDPNVCRVIRFRPYRAGMGPTFTLTTWDNAGYDNRGVAKLRYRLTMSENGKRIVLFNASDYAGSPACATDSDENHAGLMGFLTLREGDTDGEYFKDYTPAQIAYRDSHAETLCCEVMSRFGEF